MTTFIVLNKIKSNMKKISKNVWILIVIFGSLGVFYAIKSLIPSDFDQIAYKTTIDFNQTELDLGVIKQMEPKSAEFRFTNSGENKLLIYNIKPSCGCTNVDWTKGPIKNGESGKISVVYDAGTVGRFEKSIEVFCNNEIGSVVLQITGEVIAE
jgi:hypothetical protein